MTRKAKRPAVRPEPFSGDRKLRNKIAGTPAIQIVHALANGKEKEPEIKGECSKQGELSVANTNCADTNRKNEMEKIDDHAEKLSRVENKPVDEDLEEFDQVSSVLGEDEQQVEDLETNEEDSSEDESSDDEHSDDEVSGEENASDDSIHDSKCSELEKNSLNTRNLMTPSSTKTTMSKTPNDMKELVTGENLTGKSRLKATVTGTTSGDMETDPCNNTKLTKPSLSTNKTGKTTNEAVKQVVGKNGEKVNQISRTRDSGELRMRAELKNNLHNPTKLPQPSTSKNNNGKASNSHLQSHVGNHGGKLAGKSIPARDSLPSSAKSHQHTEGKKNQPLTTAIGLIDGKNESGKNPDDHKKVGRAVSDLDSEEGAIEEGCDVESSDEETTTLEVFDALGINDKQKMQNLVQNGSTALPILAKSAKPNPEAKKSFAQLFKAENANKKGFKLEIMNKGEPEGDLIFEDVDVDKTTEAWGHSLIGYIAGKNPSYKAVIGYCKSWTHNCRVNFDASGWIVVKFDKEEDLKRVLEGGPYLIYGKPFIVKAMPKYFCYDKSEICKAQVWVNLPHLPLELWNARSLSMIGTRIGEPILVDSITASKERTSFARILVEVDLSEKLINDIALVLPNGKRIVQEVRYEYLPAYCEDCQAIGHDTKMCARRSKQAEDRRIRIGATAVSHKPSAASSELASLKVSTNPTFDASTPKSSKAQNIEKICEEGEDEFVEYLSKNRKKALAKGKKHMGFEGSLDIEVISAGINKAASQWQRKASVPKETEPSVGTSGGCVGSGDAECENAVITENSNPAGFILNPVGSEAENITGTTNPAGLADPVGSESLFAGLAAGNLELSVSVLEAKSQVEETFGAVKPSVVESNVVKGTRVAEPRVVEGTSIDIGRTTRSSRTYRDQKKRGNLPRSFR